MAYDLYQNSENSLADVIRYLNEKGINASRKTLRIKTSISNMDRLHLDYIQKRISALHEQKSDFEKKMQTMNRKRKAIDTNPLEKPMKQWEKLTVQEKHAAAVAMIDVILVSDETGI